MRTEIAIIGGGLAGLALAQHLHHAGRSFHLFEARDRFGGRVKTIEFDGGHFDLGPSWFWPGQPRMARLVEQFELRVFDQYAMGDIAFETRFGTVQRNVGFASMQGSWRIRGGMRALVDVVVAGIPDDRLSLGKKLVSATKEDALVFADGTRCLAEQIVLALPPRMTAELSLSPVLTSHQLKTLQAIPTWMAGQAKFVAVYEHAFWRDAGFSGDATSQLGPLSEIHDASPENGAPGALFGFVGVPPTNRRGRDADIKKSALVQLARIFGPGAETPLSIFYQDWAERVETATQSDLQPMTHHPAYGLQEELRTLWQGKLHLCSTETASDMGGYLEGALCAAEETAARLLKASVS